MAAAAMEQQALFDDTCANLWSLAELNYLSVFAVSSEKKNEFEPTVGIIYQMMEPKLYAKFYF